jgi:adenylate kinase
VLEGRSDDTESVIKQLNLYHVVTQPIVAWYGARGILLSVDAMRLVEQVSQELLTALEAMRATPSPEMDPASLARAFGA